MTVLQRLLESGLVEIDDDQQMEKLLAAATLVQKQLAEGKLALTSSTLVAMDPQVRADEPILEAVYTAVAGQWPTVKRRHPDRPVALLRGVLTEALMGVGEADAAAAVIWATASNYAPYAPLAREQEVWSLLLLAIGEWVERAAVTVWSGRSDGAAISIPAPEIPAISGSAKSLDSATLSAYLAAAAGPATDPPRGVDVNTNTVDRGSYGGSATPAWADTFGETAATGIALTVNAALQATAKSISVAPLADALGEHTARIASAVEEALAPLHAIELRSRTLMWRAALYSPSQRRPYRELPAALAVLAMAFDLANDVPPICPGSVDNLVWEAAHAVLGDERTTISGFAEAITRGDTAAFNSLLGDERAVSGRKPLVSLLRLVSTSGEVPLDVRAQLGVAPDVEVQMPDLARWLFRDLRAERIPTATAPRARGKRK
jgi:hypothetical protein